MTEGAKLVLVFSIAHEEVNAQYEDYYYNKGNSYGYAVVSE